jgi:outer membrane protein assembly factor BamA
MNRLPKILISAVILILGAGSSVTSQGQTDRSENRLCNANFPSGRPTLKRRQLSAAGETVSEVSPIDPAAQKEICLSDDSEANTDNKKKRLPGPITQIRFEGNRIFSSSELAGKLRECGAEYEASSGEYNEPKVDYCLHKLTFFLTGKGYLQAKFGEPKNEVTTRGLVLIIPVKEGLLYHLGEVEIEGVSVFSPSEIRSMLSLHQGDVADAEAISKWLFEDLKSRYAERGYLEFTAEPVPEFKIAAHHKHEGIVDLKVIIDEGREFRLGSIAFQGNDLPEQQLRDIFLVREGDVFNQKLFEDSVKRINDTGWFEIIDKDKDTDFKTNNEEGQVSITIKISQRKSPAGG